MLEMSFVASSGEDGQHRRRADVEEARRGPVVGKGDPAGEQALADEIAEPRVVKALDGKLTGQGVLYVTDEDEVSDVARART
jgi:hypothetical protein